MRALVLTLSLALPLALSLAGSTARAADPVLAGLEAELQRSAADLALPDAARPFHIAYRIDEGQRTTVQAELGGLTEFSDSPYRRLGVGLRVGSSAMDNTNFGESWQGDGFRGARLPLDPLPLAMRRYAWLASNRAYKEAVENLARKEGAARRVARVDEVPDFGPGVVSRVEAAPEAPTDPAPLVATARSLSARFLAHPDVAWSAVQINSSLGRSSLLDTDGSWVEQPHASCSVVVRARAGADDGGRAYDQLEWRTRRPEDLPDAATLAAAVDALAARLEDWRTRPAVEEEYIGPVIVDAEAAISLIQLLLLPGLEGTPAKGRAAEGSRTVVWGGDGGGGAAALRLKRRVLPSGWTVTDDPTADPALPSFFAFDEEGQPARALTLIADGIVRTHYSSRTPSKAVPDSNGHARGGVGELPRGGPGQVAVVPPRSQSPRRLHRQAVALASAYDLDSYVRIRRFQSSDAADRDPSQAFNVRSFFFGEDQGVAPLATLQAVRVYADGREEPVRGWSLAGLDVRLLRDIVAAGDSHTATLAHRVGGNRNTSLVTITAPTLLLGEVELMVDEGGGLRPPRLPSPLAEAR